MSKLDLNALNELPKVDRILALAETNAQLEKLDAEGRVAWALDNLPGEYVLSSSFGIQAAVSLHLVNQIRPDIPVILTDTGYLFPETYRFIDELTDKLKLNLKVYRATESAAWQEARYGKLWEQGVEGIEKYNDINKVEPMNRALKELNAQTWFAESDYSALVDGVNLHVSKRSLLVLYTSFANRVSMERQLPYLLQLNCRHRLLVVFFEDDEVKDYLATRPDSDEEYCRHVIAEQFAYEQRLIVSSLKQRGIMALLTTPEKLSVDVLNKYLEIKARELL